MGKFTDDLAEANKHLAVQAGLMSGLVGSFAQAAELASELAKTTGKIKPPRSSPAVNGRITPWEKGDQPNPNDTPDYNPNVQTYPIPPAGGFPTRSGGGGAAGGPPPMSNAPSGEAGASNSRSYASADAAGWGAIIGGGGSQSDPWIIGHATHAPSGQQRVLTGYFEIHQGAGQAVASYGSLPAVDEVQVEPGSAGMKTFVALPANWDFGGSAGKSGISSGGAQSGIQGGSGGNIWDTGISGPGVINPDQYVNNVLTGAWGGVGLPGTSNPLLGGKSTPAGGKSGPAQVTDVKAASEVRGLRTDQANQNRQVVSGLQEVVSEIRQMRQALKTDGGIGFRTGAI